MLLKFSDDITDNYIEINGDENEAWINRYYVDPDNVKLFVVSLMEAFQQIKEKTGAKIYKQYVQISDWDNYLKKTEYWKIENINDIDNTMIIYCNIDDAAFCIVEGLMRND